MSVLRPQSLEDESGKFKELFQKPWIMVSILLFFCFFLFMLGVGRWDLWNPDEPVMPKLPERW